MPVAHSIAADTQTRGPSGDLADAESLAWLDALRGSGHDRNRAVERLHELLLSAARFEVSRRAGQLSSAPRSDLDDLAAQAADDAVVAVMRKLDTYRGDSRFTTWAYKFALFETATRLRKLPWHGREVRLDDDGWARLSQRARPSPDDQAETSELIEAVQDAIAEVLTPHQRAVLVAITLEAVPIDVLAERRGTTRGALYKTLHDARAKLRARLAENGFSLASR